MSGICLEPGTGFLSFPTWKSHRATVLPKLNCSPPESQSGGLLLEAGYIVTGTCMASHDFQNSKPLEGTVVYQKSHCLYKLSLTHWYSVVGTQVHKHPY